MSAHRRGWISTLVVLAVSGLSACGGGGADGDLFRADPAEPTSLDRAIFPGVTARSGAPVPTPVDRWRPRFDLVSGPVALSTSTATRLEWRFEVATASPGRLENLLVQIVGDDRHFAYSKTSTTFEHAIDIGEVGVGTFELRFFVETSVRTRQAPSERLVSDPESVRVTVFSPDGAAGLKIPSAYQHATFSCSGTSDDPRPDRFANSVSFGRCFFLVDGFREDCDRCDDVGVDACARRLCTP